MDTKNFVNEVVNYEGAEVVKFSQDYKAKQIDVYLIGNLVPKERINEWYTALGKNKKLEKVRLRIHQGADQRSEIAEQLTSEVRSGILQDLYMRDQQSLTDKDDQIRLLENKINGMRTSAIPFEQLSKEVRINYEELARFGYASTLNTDFSKQDTFPVFFVSWKKALKPETRVEKQKKLETWLKFKYGLDTLTMRPY